MKFKNDRQRKAVMSKLGKGRFYITKTNNTIKVYPIPYKRNLPSKPPFKLDYDIRNSTSYYKINKNKLKNEI